ncbi:hypothetical protein F383_30828 [Gossypium arboreum]|uniref:Uncharacterized protein n=1 Tax=Gossypium arboreum TaxID=29729 RepID=A0A0B0MS92_GOSAR|nr:hypothetical protein F383_30828 [Gossypium arboreum]
MSVIRQFIIIHALSSYGW